MFREHGTYIVVEGILAEYIYSLDGAIVIPFKTMNISDYDGARILCRRYVGPMTRMTNSS